MGWTASEVCEIIKTCGAAGAKVAEFGDMRLVFDQGWEESTTGWAKPLTTELPDGTIPEQTRSIPTIYSLQDKLDDLAITDPEAKEDLEAEIQANGLDDAGSY